MKQGTIGYYVLYANIWLLAWIPLPCLYVLSDLLAFLMHKVVRYRLHVVRQNIAEAFPGKSAKERMSIESDFYQHLCDYYIETIYLSHANQNWIKEHLQFTNIEIIEQLQKKGKDIVALFGHYCNWEWIATFPLFVKNIEVGTLYKPLRNKAFNQLFQRLRTQFGVNAITKNNALRSIVSYKREDKPFIVAFIADQSPKKENAKYWSSFLNHDTTFLNGWETIAQKTNSAVIYLQLTCTKRGYYQGTFTLLNDGNEPKKEFEMLETYIRLTENGILKEPSYWLWSHKRWKLKHEVQ